MKKLFLFFALLVFTCNFSFAKSIEFSVISDAKLKTDNSVKNSKAMTPSIEKLMGAVEQINDSPSNFTVFLGDNIAGANKYSLVMFSKIINKLKKPVYVGIGEKDVAQTKNLDKKEYYRILNLFSSNKIKGLPFAKKVKGFVLVFMDGTNQFIPTSNGYYKENEIAWLDKTLKEYQKYPIVIFQHYPVFETYSINEKKLPHKFEEYQKVISHHNNVVAMITGHHNIDDEIKYDGINFITLPSLETVGQFKKITIDYDKKTGESFVKTRLYTLE